MNYKGYRLEDIQLLGFMNFSSKKEEEDFKKNLIDRDIRKEKEEKRKKKANEENRKSIC